MRNRKRARTPQVAVGPEKSSVVDMFIPTNPAAFSAAGIEFVGFVHLQHMKDRLPKRSAEHLQRHFNGDLDIMFAGDNYGSVVIGFDVHTDVAKLRESLLKIVGVDTKEWLAPPDMIETFARTVLRSSLAVN